MSKTKIIIKNALSNGAGFATEAIIAFCMLPYIIHRIGESSYGLWALIISVTGYMGILNLGLRPAINKYVAQYSALDQKEKIRDIVQVSLVTYIPCGVLIIAVCFCIAWNVENLFNIPENYISSMRLLIIVVGVQMATGLVAVVYGGVISGMQRYDINNSIEIFVMVFRTIIILIFLNNYRSLNTIAIAHFSMTIIGYFLTFYFARRIADIKGLKLLIRPKKETLLLIFSFSAITFVIGGVGRVMSYLDTVIIGSILTTASITYYTIGSRMVKYVNNLVIVLTNVLAPAVSGMDALNEDTVGNIFVYSSKISALVSFPILFFLIIQGNEFLFLWVDANYPSSYQVMVILSAAGLYLVPQLCIIPVLYGIAKHKIIMWVAVVEGLVSIIISMVLCKYFGVIGIAFGLSIPKIIIGGLIYPVFVSRVFKISFIYYLYEVYLRSIFVTIPVIAIMYLVKKNGGVDNWLKLSIEIIVCFVFHLASVYFIGLKSHERNKIFSFRL